jgi:lipoyl(octanoyl) transferase
MNGGANDARQQIRGSIIAELDEDLFESVTCAFSFVTNSFEARPGAGIDHALKSMMTMIQYLYLGRVAYDEGLRLQEKLVELRYQGRIENVLLLLEHPPVLTLGRNAKRANVLASDELLAARGVTLHEINRGGDVTYHGPGQLVGYPIFDLRSLRNASGGRLGPVDFVRLVEEALIRLCGAFGVQAGRIAGLTGVWCGLSAQRMEAHTSPATSQGTTLVAPTEFSMSSGASAPEGKSAGRKIGAIGIHVSRGITSHGFAFNVTADLRDFLLINPCGITDKPVTSLEREVASSANLPDLGTIAHETARQFGFVFAQQAMAIASIDDLRAHAAERASQGAQYPAEDTPLRIPAEVERLREHVPHPTEA